MIEDAIEIERSAELFGRQPEELVPNRAPPEEIGRASPYFASARAAQREGDAAPLEC